MTNLVGFKPANRPPRRRRTRRQRIISYLRPKPWSGKVWRRKLPVFVFLPMALALIGLTGASLEHQTSRRSAEPAKAAPRSLNGGNAWNSIGGGFAGSASQTITGRVTHVRDGDTFVIGSTPIRIANLNCAESGTLSGDHATRRARQVVAGQIVTCRLNTQTSYDRLVGKCSLAGGRDFGQIMIAETSCRAN